MATHHIMATWINTRIAISSLQTDVTNQSPLYHHAHFNCTDPQVKIINPPLTDMIGNVLPHWLLSIHFHPIIAKSPNLTVLYHVLILCTEPRKFNGLLVAKGDGIHTMKNNFIEYKSRIRKSNTESKQILRSNYPVKAVTSNVKTGKIFFYETSQNVCYLRYSPSFVSLDLNQFL